MTKIVHNRWIPFKGFLAINLFGVIFVRRGASLNKVELNHERIHTRQQLELLLLPFFVWYLAEWLFWLAVYRNGMKAYHAISFEREAYRNMHDLHYLEHRRPYAWLRK